MLVDGTNRKLRRSLCQYHFIRCAACPVSLRSSSWSYRPLSLQRRRSNGRTMNMRCAAEKPFTPSSARWRYQTTATLPGTVDQRPSGLYGCQQQMARPAFPSSILPGGPAVPGLTRRAVTGGSSSTRYASTATSSSSINEGSDFRHHHRIVRHRGISRTMSPRRKPIWRPALKPPWRFAQRNGGRAALICRSTTSARMPPMSPIWPVRSAGAPGSSASVTGRSWLLRCCAITAT